jgi:hypothetical protein
MASKNNPLTLIFKNPIFYHVMCSWAIPVAERSKARVCCLKLSGIRGSNLAEGIHLNSKLVKINTICGSWVFTRRKDEVCWRRFGTPGRFHVHRQSETNVITVNDWMPCLLRRSEFPL